MADAVLSARRNRAASRSGRGARMNPAILGAIVVLVVLIGAELLFQLVLKDRFTVKRVSVESELIIPNERLLEIAGISGAEHFFSLDIGAIQANLEAYPLIRAALVEKAFPDTVRISLTARKPLAVSFVRIDGRSVPVMFDEEGVIFQVGGAPADWDLPVISGLQLQSVRPGVVLPPMLHGFLADLRALQLASPTLFRQFSEYRIVRRGDHDFDVLVYPVGHPVPVRIGSAIDERLSKYIVMVLDVLQREGRLAAIAELDFRAGEVVYRLRGE